MSFSTDYVYIKYNQEMRQLTEGSQDGQPYDDTPVGVAVFGLGRIGYIHFSKLATNRRVRLLYCVDVRKETLDRVVKNTCLRTEETQMLLIGQMDRVLSDPRVAAVIICTPTFTHQELTLAALNSGKSVFCEKPLSSNLEGMELCYDTAARVQKSLLCAFNRRFDPSNQNIKKRIDSGEVGQVQVVKTCSRDCPVPSVEYLSISGGIFHDCAVHDIDVICWLLGEFPTSVSAYGHCYIPEIKRLGDFDTVVITMQFPSGALGMVDLSRNAVYGYDQRIEVFGPKGMLTSMNLSPINVQMFSSAGNTTVPICYSFASRYQESYANEMEHFLDCVKGITEVSVKKSEALAISKITSACERSARSGETVKICYT